MPFCTSIPDRPRCGLDDAFVAVALDDAAVMSGDGGIDQVAAQRAQSRQRAILVRAGEPAVADDVAASFRLSLMGAPNLRQPSVA